MTWHIGASTGCCHQLPIATVIRTLADAGFQAVELGTPPLHFDIWRRPDVDAVADALRETGIRAVAIHAPFGGLHDLSDPNPQHRNAGLSAVLTAAAVLQELNGAIVVVHASDTPRTVPDMATRLQHACNSLRVLQTVCAGRYMTLAIETPLPHLIGGAPGEFAQLLAAAGPDARVCLDVGHTSLGGQWDAFADLAAGRVVHVHAHDNGGVFDDHRPPGDGTIDWTRIGRRLDAMHFDRWLMLELACPAEPLAQYFHRSAEQLRNKLYAAVAHHGP